MTGPTCVISTKEYPASGGMLIVENIADGSRNKTDIIREIIEQTACLPDKGLAQSACRNTADCASPKKKAEN